MKVSEKLRRQAQMVSDEQLKRIGKEWTKIAKEKVEVDAVQNTVYGYGSELAVLRRLEWQGLHQELRSSRSHLQTDRSSGRSSSYLPHAAP
jgi:hypothetical protein